MPDSQEKKSSGKKKQPNAFIKYSSMAAQMAVITVFGALGGIKLDEHLEMETPWFTGGLTILGVILAMYFAIRDLLKG
ncbi:MAG: AtpZ/AtpI family protein [Flavobacteriales bacterium]